jgi:hypothetical protein
LPGASLCFFLTLGIHIAEACYRSYAFRLQPDVNAGRRSERRQAAVKSSDSLKEPTSLSSPTHFSNGLPISFE